MKLHKLIFDRKEEVEKGVFTFFFDKPENLSFRAGQHFVFMNGFVFDSRGPVRIFSASSAPSDDHFSFTTRYFEEKSSAFKRKLFELEEGDSIQVIGPSPIQDFFIVDNYEKEYLFLIGGIGVTPFASVVRDALNNKKNLKGKLLYGSASKSPAFVEDVKKATASMSDFSAKLVLEPQRINKERIEAALKDLNDPDVIISGTAGFVTAMSKISKEAGISAEKIKGYKLKPSIGGGYK